MQVLRRVQRSLTEPAMRKFWTKMTSAHPNICVNNGITLQFDKNFTEAVITDVMRQMLRCSSTGKVLATPVYGYNYDPENELPNHVTAISLFYDPAAKRYNLNYFNAKGAQSVRKRKEMCLIRSIGKKIEEETKKPVDIYYFNGKNLQENDDIGLCQLYSMYYLKEFIKNPHSGGPSVFVRNIINEYGAFNEKPLLEFANKYFKM